MHELADGFVVKRVIDEWIEFYNEVRPRSALGGRYRETREQALDELRIGPKTGAPYGTVPVDVGCVRVATLDIPVIAASPNREVDRPA